MQVVHTRTQHVIFSVRFILRAAIQMLGYGLLLLIVAVLCLGASAGKSYAVDSDIDHTVNHAASAIPLITAPAPRLPQATSGSTPRSTSESTSAHRAAKTSITNQLDFGITPARFAVDTALSLNPKSAGVWDYPNHTTARWRVLVQSPQAKNISLAFTDVMLPSSAKLWISAADGTQRHGPFDATQNITGQLWTPTINDQDTALIKLTVAVEEAADVVLQLTQVNHGYQTADEALLNKSSDHSANNTGSDCNINSICEEADPYADQLRSVARLIIAGQYVCSGTLLNNTSNDKTPYLLTARHCFTGNGEFDPTLDSTVSVTWNYESSVCSNADNSATSSQQDTQSGSIYRASWANTDMLLLELITPPPADYQVYYAGWDRRNVNFSQSTAIHHPRGAQKRISFDNDPTAITGAFSHAAGAETFLRVNWEAGTTEGGSSGGALFSSQKRVAGQLLGGNASCATPEGHDWFGRIHNSWIGGGTEDSRLSDWLDPNQRGQVTINGLDYDGSIGLEGSGQSPERLDKNNGETTPAPASSASSGSGGGGGGSFSWWGLSILGLLLLSRLIARRSNLPLVVTARK